MRTSPLQQQNQGHSVSVEESTSDDDDDPIPSDLLVEVKKPTQEAPVTPAINISMIRHAQKLLSDTASLDLFLERVYFYYTHRGFIAIAVERTLNLMTIAFIVLFTTFLTSCVDYSLLRTKKHLYELIVPHCISHLHWLPRTIFHCFWLWWTVQVLLTVKQLAEYYEIKQFYEHGLRIADTDLQSVSWDAIVSKIQQLDQRLDASKITNRIMRRENFLIAIFNKDLVPLRVPVIGILMTRFVEWNLDLVLFDPVLDFKGRNEMSRDVFVESVRKRCFVVGLLNLVLSPFFFCFLALFLFYRYAETYHRNPDQIGTRSFTRLAHWKFRDFTELPHYFRQRLNRAHQTCSRYMEQFPDQTSIHLARFVALVTGSFAAVLALVTLLDQDLLLNFEITPGITALFYIGGFSAIFSAAQSMIPESSKHYDPTTLMEEIVDEIHYYPEEWINKLHTLQVKTEFEQYYTANLKGFSKEFASLFGVVWLLWVEIPGCIDRVIDFVDDSSVGLDGVGQVCSFAVFDFNKHGNPVYGANEGVDEYFVSKGGKMEQSFMHFKDHHPTWAPKADDGSQFLSVVGAKKQEFGLNVGSIYRTHLKR